MLNQEQINKLQNALRNYDAIKGMYETIDVSTSDEFKKLFKSSYKIQRRNKNTFDPTYFGTMEELKTNDISLEEYLRRMMEANGMVEISFVTKALSTRFPERYHIIDKNVKKRLGLVSIPYKDREERLLDALRIYNELHQKYIDPRNQDFINEMIDEFDNNFASHISLPRIRKFDFVLWALGPGEQIM